MLYIQFNSYLYRTIVTYMLKATKNVFMSFQQYTIGCVIMCKKTFFNFVTWIVPRELYWLVTTVLYSRVHNIAAAYRYFYIDVCRQNLAGIT